MGDTHFRVYPILMWKSSGQMTCILMALKWVVYCVRQHIDQRSLMSVLVNCLVLLLSDLYKLVLCSISRISGSFTAALHLYKCIISHIWHICYLERNVFFFFFVWPLIYPQGYSLKHGGLHCFFIKYFQV